MKYVYPAVFSPELEGGYSVYFPDIKQGATQGETIAECIEMAEDFLCLALYRIEENHGLVPEPSNIKRLEVEQDDIVTLISVDTETYRRFYENKLVKKTLNIPSWLNKRAEMANINFSQTLQKALREELNLQQFDAFLPASKPLDTSHLTEQEFHAELEKGYDDIVNGNTLPARASFESIRGELEITSGD